MSKIIFVAILLVVVCFADFAQTNKNKDYSQKQEAKLIAEFNDKDNEWNKLTIDLIKIELSKNSAATGSIRIKNDENFRRRLGLLKKAMAFQKVDLSRITLLIVNEQKFDTNVLISQDCNEIPKCENCIIIRATDIDRIEKLFRPRTTRNRRR